jgi:hypothetical protein
MIRPAASQPAASQQNRAISGVVVAAPSKKETLRSRAA